MRYVMHRCLTCILSILWVSVSQAADIKLTKHDKTDSYHTDKIELELNGEITEGDSKRLIEILEDDSVNHYPSAVKVVTLFLNSSGGSYSEGVELMRTIKKLAISTYVKNGDTCFSACAMAGNQTNNEVVTELNLTQIL